MTHDGLPGFPLAFRNWSLLMITFASYPAQSAGRSSVATNRQVKTNTARSFFAKSFTRSFLIEPPIVATVSLPDGLKQIEEREFMS